MSQFSTAAPPATVAPGMDIVLPQWAQILQTITMSLLPCCLVFLYWTKQIKCERVISVSLWAYLLGVAVILAWMLANYRNIEKKM